jgi:Domain of unknown function (DUF4375)
MPDLRVQQSLLEQPDPEELVTRVIGRAYDYVNIYDGLRELEQTLEPLTPGQRHLVAIHWCIAEVCNGGLDQFFSNPTGILAPEALQGFHAVGADDYAELLSRAAREVFSGGSVPRDWNARTEALEGLATEERLKRLEGLDDAFYAGLAELYRKAAAYVRQHPTEFALP